MEGGTLLTDEFKKFATEQVMFLHITTRIPERENDGMLQEKGGRGFPYLAVLDAEGNVVAKVQQRSVDGFRSTVDNAKKYLESDAPVGAHLADQLMLPLGIGAWQGTGGGTFRTHGMSLHATTHIEILKKFLDIRAEAVQQGPNDWLVTIA